MSTRIQSSLVSLNGKESILVVVPGDAGSPYVATDEHPNWKAIKRAAKRGDATIVELFDVSRTIAQKLGRLTRRITASDGRVFVDGAEMHNALTEHILRALDQGENDVWVPLVRFFERILANPQEHSRTQLYTWLDAHDFTINQDGFIVGYKGVQEDFGSITAGPGIVNGVETTGHLDNSPGNVLEVERDYVMHDPSRACAQGLHVGTQAYASDFGRHGRLVEVVVDPADVVSVPTDSGGAKMRTCKYVVTRAIEREFVHTQAVVRTPAYIGYASTLAPVDTAGSYDHSSLADDYDDYDEDDDPQREPQRETFAVGDRIVDNFRDSATVVAVNSDGWLDVKYDGDDDHVEEDVDPAEFTKVGRALPSASAIAGYYDEHGTFIPGPRP